MIHCQKFLKVSSFRKSHLDLWEAGVSYPHLLPSQIECLGGLPAPTGPHEERGPVIVQLAGNTVDSVVGAAMKIVEHTEGNVDGFDLNCGW